MSDKEVSISVENVQALYLLKKQHYLSLINEDKPDEFNDIRKIKLLKPFDKELFQKTLEQKNLILPQTLNWLLTFVSQEICLVNNIVVNLDKLPDVNLLDTMFINKNEYTKEDFFFPKCQEEMYDEFDIRINVNDENKINYETFEGYCFPISSKYDGEKYDAIYLGTGPVYGKILTYHGNYTWTFKHNNIEELLIKNLFN